MKQMSELKLDKMVSHTIARTLSTLERKCPEVNSETMSAVKSVVKKELWLLDLTVKSRLNQLGILQLDQKERSFDPSRDQSQNFDEDGNRIKGFGEEG